MQIKTFKNKKKEWCWHIKAKNGEIIAQGEGYKNKKDMMEAIELLRQHFNPKKKEYEITSTLSLTKPGKWYQTIWASIKYNLPLALLGVGVGYLVWQLVIILFSK